MASNRDRAVAGRLGVTSRPLSKDEIQARLAGRPFPTSAPATEFRLPDTSWTTQRTRRDYGADSALWHDEAILSVPRPRRKTARLTDQSSRRPDGLGGLRIGGETVTPERMRDGEFAYDLERMMPVPGANRAPLIDDGDASVKLLRFPATSHYCRGADIGCVPGGPEVVPDSDSVLRLLDRTPALPSWPADLDADAYADRLEATGPGAVLAAFRHPSTMVDFPNAPQEPADPINGVWNYAGRMPFNHRYVDAQDPFLPDYVDNRFGVDLTQDYGAYWPTFPYAQKDHPNRYFSDVWSHLATLRPIWGMFGNDVLARGWNAFAQDRTGARKPTAYYRRGIWPIRRDDESPNPMFIGLLKYLKLPANCFISWSWSVHSPHSNVALMMGPRGGNVFALDIDVTNREAIGKIIRLIEREIGLSPFIRVGSWPKVALIYRVASGETVANVSRAFEDADLGAIEIQGEQKSLTAYGVHHKMRSCFQWIGSATPAEHGPEYAPVVSAADISALMSAIESEVGPFRKRANGGHGITVDGAVAGMAVRHTGQWVEDAAGLVIDGRSEFVRDCVFRATRQFLGNIRDAGDDRAALDQVRNAIVSRVMATLREKMLCAGNWTPDLLLRRVGEDVSRLIANAGDKFRDFDAAPVEALDASDQTVVAAHGVSAALAPAGTQAGREERLLTGEGPTTLTRRQIRAIQGQMIQDFKPYSGGPANPSRAYAAHGFQPSMARGSLPGMIDLSPPVDVAEWRGKLAAIEAGAVLDPERERNRLADEAVAARIRNVGLPDERGMRMSSALERVRSLVMGERIPQGDQVTIIPGREPIPMPAPSQAQAIAARMSEFVERALAEVYAHPGQDVDRPVILVDAPTGAGKTSRMIEAVVRDPRTIETMPHKDDRGDWVEGRRPVLIALPTYDNIYEAVARARLASIDPDLDDEAFLDEVMRLGCQPNRNEAVRKIGEMRETANRIGRDRSLPPLDIQIYSGRERAGCPYVSAITTLGSAGQGADRMCKVPKSDAERGGGDDQFDYCPRYGECAYIRQKDTIGNAHIVFIPHAFLGDGRLPDVLKHARVLIVDEQIHNQYLGKVFLKFTDFAISPEIFNDWKVAEESFRPTVEDEDDVQGMKRLDSFQRRRERAIEHNQKMAGLREILPLREWVLSRLFQALRERRDPAQSFCDLREAFDLDAWRRDILRVAEGEAEEDTPARGGDPYACAEAYVRPLAPRRPRVPDPDLWIEESDLPETAEEAGWVGLVEALDRVESLMTYLARQDVRITPALDRESGPVIPDAVRIKLDQPGVRNIRPERRMWQAIRERMALIALKEQIENDPTPEQAAYERAMMALEDEAREDPRLLTQIAAERARELARGLGIGGSLHERDARFQFVRRREARRGAVAAVEMIRFSWRDAPGWEETPVVLLDASAHPAMIQKLFKGRQVQVCKVVDDPGAALNMHIVAVTGGKGLTFSNASLTGGAAGSLHGRVNAAINLATIRDAVSMICAAHANSRVVMGSVKKVREAMLTGWEGRPASLDSCHFGAIRGIDAYKAHGASISLGRMELPIEEVDAVAACLSYDDEQYEAPFNLFGDGSVDGESEAQLYQPEEDRVLRMRDGGQAVFKTRVLPGKWAGIVQNQAREEEINQFIGRLRPVYRAKGQRPVCYVFSSVFPSHLILDDVVSIYDIAGTDGGYAGQDNVSNLPLGITDRPLLPDVAHYARQMDMAHLLQSCAWSDPTGSFLSPGEILADARKSGLIPGITDDRQALYRMIEAYGFIHRGPWLNPDNEPGQSLFGVPVRRVPFLADGWVGMSYETEEGSEGIWTPTTIWSSPARAIEVMKARIRALGGFGAQVLSAPQALPCALRALDGLDNLIHYGDAGKQVVGHAMTADEAAIEERRSREARQPIRAIFGHTLKVMTEEAFPQIVSGRSVRAPALRAVRDGKPAAGYVLMPSAIEAMGLGGSGSPREQDLREIALSRHMTRRQIAAMLSLYHVMAREDGGSIVDLTRHLQARIFNARVIESDGVDPETVALMPSYMVIPSFPAPERNPAPDATLQDAKPSPTSPRRGRGATRIDPDFLGPAADVAMARYQWPDGVYRPAIDLIRRTPPAHAASPESPPERVSAAQPAAPATSKPAPVPA